jgi:hypothetical protein
VETGSNLAESSKEGYGSKRAGLLIMMMTQVSKLEQYLKNSPQIK